MGDIFLENMSPFLFQEVNMKEIYDVWFSNVDIKNQTKLELIEKFSTEEIWNLDFANFLDCYLSEPEIAKILQNRNLDEYKAHLEVMEKQQIQLISIKDETYPHKLHKIVDKPAFLYVRGNEAILDDDSVGMVGCRKATDLGKQLARRIAQRLADRNVNIISGLANGIDKYSHLGALDSQIGKTVAVLGGSVEDNRIYPFENKGVFERILKNGGAVISEYGLKAKPEREHFPARNRLISGLSDKVIIVEAKQKSGSLITANWALEQGKDVFAVPGNLTSKNSAGTNQLIKEGAFLFSEIEDIFM